MKAIVLGLIVVLVLLVAFLYYRREGFSSGGASTIEYGVVTVPRTPPSNVTYSMKFSKPYSTPPTIVQQGLDRSPSYRGPSVGLPDRRPDEQRSSLPMVRSSTTTDQFVLRVDWSRVTMPQPFKYEWGVVGTGAPFEKGTLTVSPPSPTIRTVTVPLTKSFSSPPTVSLWAANYDQAQYTLTTTAEASTDAVTITTDWSSIPSDITELKFTWAAAS